MSKIEGIPFLNSQEEQGLIKTRLFKSLDSLLSFAENNIDGFLEYSVIGLVLTGTLFITYAAFNVYDGAKLGHNIDLAEFGVLLIGLGIGAAGYIYDDSRSL